MTARLTHAEVVARCSANGFEWIDTRTYSNNTIKYLLRCLTCGDERSKLVGTASRYGCKNCDVVARQLTHDEVFARGLEHGAKLLEPYKGDVHAKHKYYFMWCKHECETRTDSLHKGHGCGKCWFDQGPTYVYLMEHDGFDAFKIGITAVDQTWTDSRIHRHESDGWELVHKVRYETRAEAFSVEQTFAKPWKESPSGVTKEQIRFGYGETVSRGFVDLQDIMDRMSAGELLGV